MRHASHDVLSRSRAVTRWYTVVPRRALVVHRLVSSVSAVIHGVTLGERHVRGRCTRVRHGVAPVDPGLQCVLRRAHPVMAAVLVVGWRLVLRTVVSAWRTLVLSLRTMTLQTHKVAGSRGISGVGGSNSSADAAKCALRHSMS